MEFQRPLTFGKRCAEREEDPDETVSVSGLDLAAQKLIAVVFPDVRDAEKLDPASPAFLDEPIHVGSVISDTSFELRFSVAEECGAVCIFKIGKEIGCRIHGAAPEDKKSKVLDETPNIIREFQQDDKNE